MNTLYRSIILTAFCMGITTVFGETTPQKVSAPNLDPAAAIYWKSDRFAVHHNASIPAVPPTACYVGKVGEGKAASLYILFVCSDPNLAELVTKFANGGKRPICHDDSVEVYLDINHDQDDYHQIIANAAGAKWAGYFDKRGAFPKRKSFNWNPGANVKTSVNSDAQNWTCEIKVPFQNLNGTPKKGAKWGVNFCRNFRGQFKDPQLQTWFPVFLKTRNFHRPELFGVIEWPGEDAAPVVDDTAPAPGENAPTVPTVPVPVVDQTVPPTSIAPAAAIAQPDPVPAPEEKPPPATAPAPVPAPATAPGADSVLPL